MSAAELGRLGEAYFAVQHAYDPYNATLLGVADFDGLTCDPSREASQRAALDLAAIGRQVAAIGPAGLTGAQRVDLGVLTALLEGARSDAEHSLWAANASAQGYVSRQGLIFQAVRTEIDRYIGWPGQALAYVTGRREIVRLRERARHALGPRFELRRFHHAVLGNGAIPLTVLDDEIGRWTTAEASA
jgi:uncharacterized protein (DUF885 family)